MPCVREQREATAPHADHDLYDHEHGSDAEREAQRPLRAVLMTVPVAAMPVAAMPVAAMPVAAVGIRRIGWARRPVAVPVAWRIVVVRGAHLGSKAPTHSLEKHSAKRRGINDILGYFFAVSNS
jgi:hypothetical protein